MKKYIWISALAFSAISCEKIKQTTDTIKQADSLITTVSKGYKTLDSISTVINDSAKVNSEFRKQKEIVERQINIKNLNTKNLDSVADALKKISAKTNSAVDISKTIDSVQNELKNTDDPMKSIAIISKTIDKAMRQSSQNQQNSSTDSTYSQPNIVENVLVKKGNYEVEVSDFEEAKIQLENILRNNSAQIITNYDTTSSTDKEQTSTVRIPAKNYDNAVAEIKNLGQVSVSAMSSTGSKYNPEQLYDMTIMIHKPFSSLGNSPVYTPNSPVYPQDYPSLDSFGKYLTTFVVTVVLILLGLIYWLISGTKRRKEKEKEIEQQRLYEQMERLKREKEEAERRLSEQKNTLQPPPIPKPDPDDYSRFMPK